MFNIKQYCVVSLYSFCCRLATAGKYVGIPMTITVCQKYFYPLENKVTSVHV